MGRPIPLSNSKSTCSNDFFDTRSNRSIVILLDFIIFTLFSLVRRCLPLSLEQINRSRPESLNAGLVFDGNRAWTCIPLVNVGGRSAVKHEAKQFWSAIVATRVHHLFAPVNQREVQISNHHALSRAQRLSYQLAVRRDDCRK